VAEEIPQARAEPPPRIGWGNIMAIGESRVVGLQDERVFLVDLGMVGC
jgi:hypothetical protein